MSRPPGPPRIELFRGAEESSALPALRGGHRGIEWVHLWRRDTDLVYLDQLAQSLLLLQKR